MGKFTRGSDGRVYYGKGTKGGLAPVAPTFNGSTSNSNLPAIPGVPSPINEADTVGSYSAMDLIKQGITAGEIQDATTRPAAADLPKTSWGKLALEEADMIGYSQIARLSGGKYLVAASYDNLVENHDLNKYPSTDQAAKAAAYDKTVPIQKLLASMKASAVENNYSQEDVERINRVMAGYTDPNHLNTRAFHIDSSSGSDRVVYSNDMVRILNLAKVAYAEEAAEPSEGTKRLISKAEAQKLYMRNSTTASGSNGGFMVFKTKPSKDLIDARIKVKLAQEQIYAESRRKATFDLFSRKEKKVEQLSAQLAHYRKSLEILENRKTI
jgi:hypothetical protein